MLNKQLLLHFAAFLFQCVFLCSARSQEDDDLLLVEGKLWTATGDTIHGELLYINQFNYQFNVTIIDTANKSSQVYSPKDLAGFIYYIDNEGYEFLSMSNPSDIGRLFLRVLYRGKFTLFQLLELNQSSPALSYKVYYYLWDKDWLYPPLTQQYEEESLLKQFSDCPELEFKIKSGAYGLSQIRQIITEYEKCKLTDTYEYFFE
jgi:hypothetical protein